MKQLFVSTDSMSSQTEAAAPTKEEESRTSSTSPRNSTTSSRPSTRTSTSSTRPSLAPPPPPKPSRVESCPVRNSSTHLHPLRQCLLHRSSSSAASVPTGWWHQPNSDLWNERYQMGCYLCSIGRFGQLYTCFSEATGAELTVKVVRKSRWSNSSVQPRGDDWKVAATTSPLERQSSLDVPKLPRQPNHYLHHPHRNHLQEYSILKSLQHPNILQVFDLIEDPRHYYIVTQFYNPNTQSLSAYLQDQGRPFTEQQVAPIMYQMLSCIHYCHHRNIVHCNLRLDAFSITHTTDGTPLVQLTDFGNAVVLCDLTDDRQKAANLRLMEPRGTIRYMAPEVVTLDKSYGSRCDVWSLGIVLYVLLTNTFPLDGTSFKQVQEMVLKTLKQQHPHWLIPKFRTETIWQAVSDECKHFVHLLLAPLEEHRPTPEQALQHPWMQPHWSFHPNSNSRDSGISTLSADSDDHYQTLTSSLLTNSTASLPVIEEVRPSLSCESSLESDLPVGGQLLDLQHEEAIDTFLLVSNQILDEWNSTCESLHSGANLDLQEGTFSRENVRQAYKILFASTLSDSQLDQVFAEFDAGSNDQLQGLDFFVAVLNEKDLLFTHALQEAFEVFDINHSGLVSTTYLSQALRHYANEKEELAARPKGVVLDLIDQVEADARELNVDVIAIEELVAMILESSIPKPEDSTTTTTATTTSQPQQSATKQQESSWESRDHPSLTALPPSPSWESSVSGTSKRSASRRLSRLSLRFCAKHFIAQRSGRLCHHYELTDFANEGGCGAVWFCTHKETGMERAVKLVRKARMDADYNRRILEEFLILRELDHPNILKQYELFEDPDCFYIIMDAARGGDLCDELDEFGAFLESAAALLMKQLLSSINYLHFSGFVHCDLKPENIVLEANKELSQIKVIDFGFAANITKAPNQRLSKKHGTLQYTAPEVFAGDYGKKVDLWSAGVICFLLLSDEFPFIGATREDLLRNVQRGKFSFSSEHWNHVSELGKDFVSKLLTVDENTRLSAAEALDHPWIRVMTDSASSELKPADFLATAEALSNLMQHTCNSKLKQATYSLIASQLLVKEEKQAIDSVFKRLDTTSTGRLTRTEIRLAIRNFLGVDLSDQAVDEVFKRVDVACTGFIEYSEFLMAAMTDEWILKSGKLKLAFDVFDANKTGFITFENMKDALAGFLTGNDAIDNAVMQEIAKIVMEVDTNKDDMISFDEFVATMSC